MCLNSDLQTPDGPSDSTVRSGLVPWDEIQGSRQRSTRQVENIYRRSFGICQECHEGLSPKQLEVGQCFKSRCNQKCGEGISQSITSDCLSRLEEDREQTGFDEDVVRGVSGIMFAGESVLEVPGPIPAFLIVGYSCVRDGMSGQRSMSPVTSLILHLDKADLESVLLSNGPQPKSDEESPRGIGSSRRQRRTS